MSVRVFIADDHAVVRDGLRHILEAEKNITVIGDAADGRRAVREVKKLNPDVVVMDIAMPELNGIEATRQIVQHNSNIKMVILSMHSDSEHIFRALEAGAKGYVLKESAGQEVVRAVRSVSTGGRYLSSKIMETAIEDYIRQRRGAGTETPLDLLSPREREILHLVVEGKSSAQIAEALFLSRKTIETYRSRLMRKLGIKDIPTLVKFAIQQGLIP